MHVKDKCPQMVKVYASAIESPIIYLYYMAAVLQVHQRKLLKSAGLTLLIYKKASFS